MQTITLTAAQQAQAATLKTAAQAAQETANTARQALQSFLNGIAGVAPGKGLHRVSLTDDGANVVVQ